MSLYDLLPPNSTQLERDLSRAVSFLPKLQGGPPTIRTAKRRDIPPSVLPWLVYEYGLGEISAYLQGLNDLIDQGVAWQRIRGTPASIVQAMSWLGLTATIDESEAGTYRWSEFQIGLPEAASDATTRDVIYLAGISAPARSRLNRVFAVYDLRRFVLDDSLLSGGGILSDHSGTRPEWAGGTQISYGRNHGAALDAMATVDGSVSPLRGAEVPLNDRWILSHSILGGDPCPVVWGGVWQGWILSNSILGADPDPGGWGGVWHELNRPPQRVTLHAELVPFGEQGNGWSGAWGAFPWTQSVAGVFGGRIT